MDSDDLGAARLVGLRPAALALPTVAGQPGDPDDHDGGLLRGRAGLARRLRHGEGVAGELPRQLPARQRATPGRRRCAPRRPQGQQIPSYAAGVADVRLLRPDRRRQRGHHRSRATPRSRWATPRSRWRRPQREQRPHGRRARHATTAWSPCPHGDGQYAVVLVAGHGAPRSASCERLGAVMLLFGLAGVIGAAAAGWAVARNGLRPVRRLTRNVERDRPHRGPRRRCPVEGDDEIARLATAFNEMLVALSASRDRQRRLVADAGHELRTPLTSLRTNLDLLLQADAGGGLDDPRAASCSTTYARRSRRCRPWSATWSSWPATSRCGPCVEQVDLAEVVDRAVVAGPPPRHRPDVRRRHRAVVGDGRVGGTRARGDQPARQRREVEPARRHGRGSGCNHGDAHRRRRGAGHRRGRPRRTSSTASTAPTSRARCRAPASACRSSGRSSSATRGTSASTRPTRAAPGWCCRSPAPRCSSREVGGLTVSPRTR